jgi:hypothetical protein
MTTSSKCYKNPYIGEYNPPLGKFNRWSFQIFNSTMPYGHATVSLMLKQDLVASSTYVLKHEDAHPNVLFKLHSHIHHIDQTSQLGHTIIGVI